MAGVVTMCIRIAVQMETGFPVLVIPVPGLDPGIDSGITPIDGVRGDPRITSGDDEETTGMTWKRLVPAESFSGVAVILMPGTPRRMLRLGSGGP
jgi:hypothetical protein